MVTGADGKPKYDHGHDLVYRDGFIYATAQNDDRLGIIEVLDPEIRRKAKPAPAVVWKAR